MKDYLVTLAKYNRDANKKVAGIFDKLSVEDLNKDRGSFFGSLYKLFDHIALVSLMRLKQIISVYPEYKSECKYIDKKIDFGKTGFPEYAELKDAISNIDDVFVDIADKLPEDKLSEEIIIETPRGKAKQTAAFIIIQHVNHSTHHRGAMAQILDEMKIDNDFSSLKR